MPPDNDEDQPPPKSFLRFLRYNKQWKDKVATPTASKTIPTTTIRRTKSQRKKDVGKLKSGDDPNSESTPGDPSVLLSSHLRGSFAQPPVISPTVPPPPPGSRAAMFVRRPGESMRSYLERIDIESKNRIVDCFRKERKKSNKRKE